MAFCPNCGSPVNDTSKFCPSCGSQLPIAQTSQPSTQQQNYSSPQPSYQQEFYAQRQQPSRPQYAAPSSGGKDYRNLGGWLLFFVIGWGLSALSGVASTFELLGSLPAAFAYSFGLGISSLLSLLTYVVSVAVSVLMVVLIVQRNHAFLRLYQLASIASLAINLLSSVVAGVTTSHYGGIFIATISSSIGVVVGTVVGLCLMTLYFCKSVRVRTYMGSSTYLDDALFTLGK